MTERDAWPFLISRGRNQGYQVIVAPAFMVDDWSWEVLDEYAGTSSSPVPSWLLIQESKSGPLTIVYRVVPASPGAEEYRDSASRPIVWVEGLVFRGTAEESNNPNSFEAVEQAFDAVHAGLAAPYRHFWEAGDGAFSVVPSEPLGLVNVGPPSSLAPPPVEETDSRTLVAPESGPPALSSTSFSGGFGRRLVKVGNIVVLAGVLVVTGIVAVRNLREEQLVREFTVARNGCEITLTWQLREPRVVILQRRAADQTEWTAIHQTPGPMVTGEFKDSVQRLGGRSLLYRLQPQTHGDPSPVEITVPPSCGS